jgi:hypothetical protein
MSNNFYQQSLLNKSRSDKFILTLGIPAELKKLNTRDDKSSKKIIFDSLQFSVFGCVVPSEVIPQIEVRYGGGNVYVSSHSKPSYEPITVNFTIDNEFKNYWVIHKWLQILRDEKSSIFSGNILENDVGLGRYSSDFKLIALDEFEKPVIEWTYKNAFPISLGELSYNHREPKELETSFQFVFSRIETNLIPY